MSTQSYYRDRLGFDQNEWNDGVNTPVYEANLSKSKDERDAIQKKTFTKWVNKHLKKAGRHVNDLFEDLQDGHNLISLLEVLSGQHLPREKGRLRFHMLQNIQMCLNFLRYRKIKLVNIRAEDIVDGNPKLTLGLIWTIILHFQISDIVVGQEPNVSPRDVLLRWAKRSTNKYSGVRISDFTSSWRDGLAFNAIIHRNRPDLIDWRTIRQRQIRERLENAFHVAEREYGVTRLLDVEDVDTNEPDEKSLITYISSLYDVFPDPPVNHPLLDSESQQRTNTYREMANSLHLWIRDKLIQMQDRTFPNTLIEVKKLATESSRFRNEDIPAKQREKQRLNNAFRELTKFYDSIGEIDIEPELHIETIEKNWSRLLIAHQEKDKAIQDELKRLEKLQRLAEKVHREMKQVDSRLEELEQRVEMEAARLDRLHPLDAKNIVDQLEHDIRLVEENIQFLFTDVQILREGRYAQSSELHKRVERLHQRWVQLRSLLHARLITPLSSISFPIEERTVTRQTRTVLETRLVDTNTHFRQLQECTEWVKNKLTHIGDGEYGSDLPGAQAELELMQREHKTVEQFQTKIQQCVSAKNNFHGEELQLYAQHLNMLQKLYAELLVLSNKRLSDLETLQDFLQSATNELVWLNEKEDTEVSRDWSDKNLNLSAIHHYYESLMSELERREIQFSAVVDRGEALVLQRHPASKCIEAYMTALQNQWSWVLQLTLCLETHLKHAQTYQQFYADVKEAETWITKRDEMLNTIYSQSEFSLDEGERLLKGMQDLREELNHYGDVISQLAETSKDVVPLKQRRQPVTKPIKVRAVCDYKQANIHINKNESCVLHDNSGRVKWRVTNLSGVESNIPGVVLTIPPPDKEAIDAVDRLRRQFDRSVALWQKKQLRMRQNMIFATIKVVKTWDLAQFIAMGQEQRTAIRRALNDDADKLISEGDPSDPQLRRLRREMDEVNRLFDEFEKRARDDEESKNMSRVFENQTTSLQIALDEAESTLNGRIASPLPRDLDSLEHMVIQHKEFESRLQTLSVRVDEVQKTYREITRKTSQQETKLKKILTQWDSLWHSSRLYVERLKCVEILLSGLDEASNTVSELEHKLSSFTHMPSEIKQLQQVHEELLVLQTTVTTQQHVITQLREDAHNTRRVVEESRKHKGPFDDLNRIDSDVTRLSNRWSSVVSQLSERLRSCESAYGMLQKFSGAYEAEVTFVEDSYSKLNTSQEVEATKGMYTNVIERTQHIEQVNIVGGRCIREAKQAMEEKYRVCDDALQKLLQWVGDVEHNIAHQDVVQEDSEQLRNQINIVKAIKDDVHAHNRPVTSCLDQVRQIVATGGEVLSSEEISSLEKNGQNLKKRFDRVQDRSEKLLKKLIFARDELSKFKTELSVFCTWMDKARRSLEEKERVLSDLNKLASSAESTRDFVSDVIVHQADLRFITMSAQKFVDESKEYLSCLNEFRTSLPQRLPHIEPVSSQDSMVRNEVSLATTQYRDLLSRANALSDKLSGLGGRQREYRDALEKARAWLKDAEPRASKLISEPVGADLRTLEEQLARAKSLNSEFVANGRLIDNAKQAVTALLRSLEGQQSPAELEALEAPVREVEDKYLQLAEALAERLQILDTALVQSQGVQDALDSLIQWLNTIENQLKSLMKPASLNKERLDEQLREQRLIHAEIESHRASLESVAYSAQDLINNSSNSRLASKIQAKLSDVLTRYEKIQMKTLQRGDFLEEISQSLSKFNVQVEHFEQWYADLIDQLESRDLNKLSHEEFAHKIEQFILKREKQRNNFEEMINNGKNLIAKKDVTDVGVVREKIKALENLWKDLNISLEEKQKASRARAEQLNAYERLRDSVLDWLNNFESRVNRLEVVALDLNILKRQSDDLKPLVKEYRDYAATLDKLNDLGSSYDSLTRSDSPSRRRSAYSPAKRQSVARRSSQDGRSPSPSKNYAASPVSPSGSSGFSSRRSSQENFHLEELSPVQQQLSEINHRYSLLGVKLNDRQTEIDTMREEVKKYLDNIRALGQFLDKVQRQLPKESVPMTRDESDKAAKVVKLILEEMYEKQSLLDNTRSQVKDLLRRKSGASGADTLHDELEDVTSRWKSLNDRCKSRIKLFEDLKDFHDTHDNLSNWLSAKDRMMSVLGPISSDSRMVQSQVQQVQVLREEFRSQQPQLQHLTEIGESILSQVDKSSPDGQRLAARLSAILQRWADLLGRLEERASSLGAAADTSREFDAGVARLRDALQAISDQLDDLPLDKDPEEQLRKIQNLERQLEGQRPLLADIEAAGAHLSEVLTDPASRAEIQSKLQGLARQYNTLQKKLDHRKAEIEGSLRDGRQLEQSCARTVGWLAEELGSMSERLLISADRHVLQQQLEHHEPIYKEVMNKEHEIIMLLNKAKDALNKTTQRSDTRNLQRDVEKIQQLWDKLRKETLERQTRLQTCMEHCKKYYRGLDSFLPWLNTAEDKLEVLKPATFKKKDIERQLKELSAFRNEVWKHSGEYENTRMLGETFQGSCDIDKEVVRNELTTLKQRWDKLNNDLLERTQHLEDTARTLSDFNENLRELEHSLQRCEDKLSNHDASDPKLLEKIRALKEESSALKKPLQALRQQASDLVAAAGEIGVDASHLQDEVDVLSERLDHLSARLDDRCSELQSAATAVQQFNEQVKSLGADLSSLEQELDAMKPPGRDLKTVRNQLDEIARFIKKINKAADDVNNLVSAGEHLVDSGFAPDTLQTREQAETLRRSLARLDERARNREEDLDNTLQKLEQFYQLHTAVMEDIQEAQEQVRRLKPVGSEVEGIKAQQEESRTLRRNIVEPLSQQVSECNRKGQTLIQSAAGGVNTNQIEKDLEKMNEKWNQLKEKMNERDRKLDVGLLQSGKFQEALDGLAKWLSDTEEMVANQKPPSADYKVVKAQLQEQKFLKKMLLDRQASMSSLFAMGQEVAAGAEPSERKAIERQLKELMGRFDNLTEGAQRRMLDLEQAMRVAKDFQDKLVPIVEWLDKTEKRIKDMELVPTDEEKIQQRIKEHDVLHNEILRKKPSLMELTEIADNLMSLVGEDEATTVADKLSETAERYSALCNASDAVGQLLQASRAGLRHLVLTYQDLQAWMEAMEKRLNSHRALGVHTEKLLQQMDDLADLTEEISNRHTQVDSTVDAGLELMKHISNDEAIQLKDKLDSLQRRYNDLTSRGAELLKNAQEALPLVQQFHNCHHRLVDWMMGAESQLQREPRQEEIQRLEADIQEFRPVLESINLVGPQLCQLSPGEGAATIEGLVTRDNRRFDAIAEQIQRKAERFNLSKQRSLEVTADMDELLEWFREVENTLREVDPPSSDPDAIRAQLKEHRALQDDITSQKSRGRDVISTAKKVLREASQHDDTTTIREKLEDLREIMDIVSALSSDRLGVLEQALPLAEHFLETHNGLASWLDDIEAQVNMLAMPALRPDHIAQQQDRNEMFIQWISDQKPLVDKLNKTGEALIRLVNEDDGAKVQDLLDADNARYSALRAQLRQRQQALEQALQESSRFSDKLEGMLRALQSTAEQIKGAEPVSAHPPKIRDQLEENNALCEDLETREEAFQAVKRAADDVINKAGNRSDPAIKDIKRKLDKLNTLWNEVQKATSDRGKTLDEALAVAEKFWSELQSVMASLRDLSTSLNNQEPPAAQKEAIKVQQELLQEIKQEIDQTKPEVEQVRQTGHTLMKICGEPDKPEVKKHIEDLDTAWDNITALYARREENLIDAMEKAMEFHYTLQNLLEFLERAEDKFANMGPLGSDIDAVKKQIAQLKNFKDEVDPQMVKVEALNRQAHELTERTSVDQALAIKEPLNQVNRRWDDLLRGMVERQRQLEQALLRLGQFQHALSELIKWIGITNSTLDNDLKPVPGDPQVLEVELAKLKVLVNDIQAHQSSVDALNDAGRQLIESSRGSQEASSTQEQLKTLNRQWRDLLQKAADRQRELEDSLKDAQRFHAEIQDLLSWLSDVDGVIAASKPVGGLPETASEQLQRFMEVFEELESNRPKVESVLQQGNEYLKRSTSATNLQHNLKTLKQRWDSVTARANDKKIKLEIALKEATEFHDALQAFVDWLTSAEKTLVNLKPVSRVMETILVQIEEHKAFQKEVSTHRETMLNLDKKGTHLKYFSQKQDVILIKNLLISVQHRWERVVSKSAERTRALDHGYKEAKEFHDAWSSLMHWLTDTENQLDELANETGNDPERIKQRLAKHREFQRALSGKQATYDATMRSGKALKDKAPKSDEIPLREMMSELKNKWTTVCAKSVDRQRKLEEALLFSGQFKDAVSALMEWLQKADKILSEEGPVHGDLDTVNSLVDQHRQFEEDLQGRLIQLEQVKRTGKDLQEKASVTDATAIRQQLSELTSLWDKVVRLKERRGKRLEEALKEAQQLHKSVDMLLEWLSDAEMKLRFSGVLPEDEQETRNQIAEHEKFLRELNEKERDKDSTINLAQRILAKAHPDAVSVIKHWITIIQSRWDEVSSWAKQRRQRLDEHIRVLRDADELLEELLAWLSGLEKTLLSLEAEPLPDDIPTIEHLIADHKEFMENTQQRQGEVDSVCKSRQVQAATKDRKTSRPKTPSRDYEREGSPDFDALSRKSSLAKSRESLSGRDSARRGSRGSPTRDSRSDLPHYGPRFPPKGTKGAEPTFRNPRVKLLWDRWRNVWVLAWERQRRLQDKLNYLIELEKIKNFSWDEWRKRFLKFMNHKKSRLTDLFRKMDKNNDGLIPRDDFIDGIIKTKFDTSKLEMETVANLFDHNNGLIDWKEFIAALRPDWEERRPDTEADKIHDEVKRLVMLCTCRQKFRVFQVGEGKYRFGDSQKLRLVRILRSTVMVRVGGGWVALEEFLQKNDPCRAKGRTNIELREQFILADGVSQSMSAFKPKTSTGSRSTSITSGSAGPITKVRERSIKSVPMGSTKSTGRSSFSGERSTPDSLSDNEGSFIRQTPGYRKTTSSYRSSLTPGGSLPGSRNNSRPASRTGSKPPSRHGSNLSLDSTDDGTPSRIPRSSTLPRNSTSSTRSRLNVPNGSAGGSRPRTPTGAISPAGGSRARTPSASGSTTPIPPGMSSAGSKLQRKASGASDISTSASSSRKGSKAPTPTDQRAPFRL